ncbi:MAG: sigma-54-dependent Fis family transcriptional regulator [Sphingomonadales bacterium]|nr:sigma-54-dependent Fis family transcriptional regulator [Sphingomonadales bacterium]
MKTLISWIAHFNDFENGQFKPNGPTASFHKYFFKHERHVLLSGEANEQHDNRAVRALAWLKAAYPDREIDVRYLNISDPIDHQEIQSKVSPILAEFKDDKIDIFVSPGTGSMQLVWYLSHMHLGLQTTLYQTREAKFSKQKDKDKPELIKIELEQSALPVTAMYHQEEVRRNTGDNYFLTPAIEKVYNSAAKVAQVDAVSVLILGASGTGKENLAKFIHKNSARKDKPYIAINCSAFSDALLESRLFGYKKGAFTGADKDTTGLFEQAHEGIIFLDEIGDISPYMQQSLLRVLQEKEIMPLGGKAKKVDVRVLAATNQNLPKLCEEGKFRWDLYYRLSVVELDLPTLHARGKTDLKQLMDHFVTAKKKELHRPKKLVFDKVALEIMLNYTYPGNVRELENIISRLYVFNEERITLDVLPKRLKQAPENQPMNMDFVEKQHILKVLQLYNGNITQTSKAIGWVVNTLKTKMKKYGISVLQS